MALLACGRAAMVSVPIYDTFANASVEFVVEHAQVGALFCDATNLLRLATQLPKSRQRVRHVYYWGSPAAAHLEVCDLGCVWPAAAWALAVERCVSYAPRCGSKW